MPKKRFIAPAVFAIHADRDIAPLEQAGKRLTGELAALVGVEDVGFAVTIQRLFDRRRWARRLTRSALAMTGELIAVAVRDRS